MAGGWSGAGSGALSGAAAGAAGGPIGIAIGAGLGALGGGLLGGSSSDDPTKALQKDIPTLLSRGNTASDTGLSTLGNAGNFYNTILGGNREAISNLLGPQISTILSQYDNASNAIRQFSPRGGGSTQTLAQLPFQKAAAAGGAFQSVLPSAAQGAADVGAKTGQIGSTNLSIAHGGTEPYLHQGQFDATQAAAAGKGYGQLITNLGGLLKKNGSSGGGAGGGIPSDDAGFG